MILNYEFLKISKEDDIAVVTITKEKSLNALNTKLITELGDLFKEIEEDKDISVVILTGAGKAFVAGADISEMVDLKPQEAYEFAKRGNEVFLSIENSSKVVIAAVNGFALGGGCELSLACDIRIASSKAKFGQPEVGLGITPGFGGTQRLPRLIGTGLAKELIYTADVIGAQTALEYGIVNHVVDPEELMDKAMEIAKKTAKNSINAVINSKRAINLGMQTDITTGVNIEQSNFELCFTNEDRETGMRAFLNKEKPNYKKN